EPAGLADEEQGHRTAVRTDRRVPDARGLPDALLAVPPRPGRAAAAPHAPDHRDGRRPRVRRRGVEGRFDRTPPRARRAVGGPDVGGLPGAVGVDATADARPERHPAGVAFLLAGGLRRVLHDRHALAPRRPRPARRDGRPGTLAARARAGAVAAP